jgi:hypothetical protein
LKSTVVTCLAGVLLITYIDIARSVSGYNPICCYLIEQDLF